MTCYFIEPSIGDDIASPRRAVLQCTRRSTSDVALRSAGAFAMHRATCKSGLACSFTISSCFCNLQRNSGVERSPSTGDGAHHHPGQGTNLWRDPRVESPEA
eukprot:353222-Chlamydomonas_euryale.AAC.14